MDHVFAMTDFLLSLTKEEMQQLESDEGIPRLLAILDRYQGCPAVDKTLARLMSELNVEPKSICLDANADQFRKMKVMYGLDGGVGDCGVELRCHRLSRKSGSPGFRENPQFCSVMR
jgi:hypothetical protein